MKRGRTGLSRSSTQNYDRNDPYRPRSDSRQSDSHSPRQHEPQLERESSQSQSQSHNDQDEHEPTTPLSINHGVGYDFDLDPVNAPYRVDDRDSGNENAASDSQSSRDDSGSAPTDHELELSDEESRSPPMQPVVDDASNGQRTMPLLNEFDCSAPIIEEEHESGTDDHFLEMSDVTEEDEEEDENVNNTNDAEQKQHENANDEELPSPKLQFGALSDDVAVGGDKERLALRAVNTNEIGKQTYDLTAPPTRHLREDTIELRRVKRGSLSDIALSLNAGASNQTSDEHYESDMPTPEPKEEEESNAAAAAAAAPNLVTVSHEPQTSEPTTMFTFGDAIAAGTDVHPDFVDADESSEAKDGVADMQRMQQPQSASRNGKSVTPISRQQYDVAAPPTKHKRDESTLHNRSLGLPDASDLRALQAKVGSQPHSQRSSSESSSSDVSLDNESEEQVMNMEQLRSLENEPSDKQLLPEKSPNFNNAALSTGTQQFIDTMGYAVNDKHEAGGTQQFDDDEDEEDDDSMDGVVILEPTVGRRSQVTLNVNPLNAHSNTGTLSLIDVTHLASADSTFAPTAQPDLPDFTSADTNGSQESEDTPPKPLIPNTSIPSPKEAIKLGSELLQHASSMTYLSADASDNDDDAQSVQTILIKNQPNEHSDLYDQQPGDADHKYTHSMKSKIPKILADTDSMEIDKQIQTFKEQHTPKEHSGRKHNKAALSSPKLHHSSPTPHMGMHAHHHQAYYSPVAQRMHSPYGYDQNISRPEWDQAGVSARNHSVESRRSKRSDRSSSTRGSKRNSTSNHSKSSKESSKRRSKHTSSSSRHRNDKSRDHHNRKHGGGSSNSKSHRDKQSSSRRDKHEHKHRIKRRRSSAQPQPQHHRDSGDDDVDSVSTHSSPRHDEQHDVESYSSSHSHSQSQSQSYTHSVHRRKTKQTQRKRRHHNRDEQQSADEDEEQQSQSTSEEEEEQEEEEEEQHDGQEEMMPPNHPNVMRGPSHASHPSQQSQHSHASHISQHSHASQIISPQPPHPALQQHLAYAQRAAYAHAPHPQFMAAPQQVHYVSQSLNQMPATFNLQGHGMQATPHAPQQPSHANNHLVHPSYFGSQARPRYQVNYFQQNHPSMHGSSVSMDLIMPANYHHPQLGDHSSENPTMQQTFVQRHDGDQV